MELHQLLRHVNLTTPICIFDIAGVCISKVSRKESIPKELYDYDVLEITTGMSYVANNKSSCLYIFIQK